MKYNIVIEPEAFEDLLRIKQYISKQDSIVKANIFLSELKLNTKISYTKEALNTAPPFS
jgi:mRNA-degrading endonuclease RelE of RelBE toxin-antitoxin system